MKAEKIIDKDWTECLTMISQFTPHETQAFESWEVVNAFQTGVGDFETASKIQWL